MAQPNLFTLTKAAPAFFMDLHEPKQFMKNGKPKGAAKYSINAVLKPDSEDLKTIAGMCKALADAAFAGQEGYDWKTAEKPYKKAETIIDARKKSKAKDGKEYSGDLDWIAGTYTLKASSTFAPALSGLEGGRLVEYKTEEARAASKAKFYNGAEVLMQVNLQPYEMDGRYGVTAYLNMVLTTGKGEKRGGTARAAADVFKGYAGTISHEDPMGADALEEQF